MSRKILKSLANESFASIFATIFIAYSLLMAVGISGDMFLHPWIKITAREWHWYSYMFSPHAFTLIFINHGLWVLIPICFVALVWSVVLYNLSDDYAGEIPDFLWKTWSSVHKSTTSFLREKGLLKRSATGSE